MTTESRFRLADSTTVEPLVNLWPAWAHVISPVTASLHLLRHQITTLESYLQSPETHFKLARDPKYAGSPFSNVPADRADEMHELLASTLQKQRANLDFGRAIIEFHNLLVDEAKGQSLNPYYERMPELLRGYAELVYDYYHNPTIRFLEGMLYESEYYDSSLQSLRLFNLRNDSRPFFLSTPRLRAADEIEWNIPFASPLVDELFRLDVKPQPLSRIRQFLPPEVAPDHLLLPLLSEAPVSTPERWRGEQARIRYVGHACVLVEWNGVSILTDPCVSARPTEGGVARLSYNDLPEKIDFALVTHAHQDHFVIETLLRLRSRIECLIVPKSYGLLFGDVSLSLLCQKIGFKHVLELDTLESIQLPDGEIIGVPFLGEHGDLAQGKLAYVVRAGTEQMLFAADSDCLDKRMYDRLCRILGPIQNVFIGTESVGGPLTWHNGSNFPRRPTPEQNRTRRYHGCDARRALHLLEAVKARRLYVYAMGKEPWFEHLLGLGLDKDSPQLRESRELIARACRRGFQVAERPFGHGEIYLGGPEGERSDSFTLKDYWHEQLNSFEPLFAPTQSSRIMEQSVSFSAEFSTALAEFSRRHSYSLLTVTLSAFQSLLYWYTGRDDIVVCSRAGDLSLSEVGTQSESPTQLIPLRTDLSGEPSFLNLIDRVNGVVNMALAHRDNSPSLTNFSQVMFRFIKTDELVKHEECILALNVNENQEGIATVLQYDDESFAAGTITAMLEQYRLLLERAIEDCNHIITDFPVFVDNQHDSVSPAILENSSQLEDQFVF